MTIEYKELEQLHEEARRKLQAINRAANLSVDNDNVFNSVQVSTQAIQERYRVNFNVKIDWTSSNLSSNEEIVNGIVRNASLIDQINVFVLKILKLHFNSVSCQNKELESTYRKKSRRITI